ncbi:MAG: dephospho-CoA kinase [Burkholderiales bacterium]|nr:dephospho-CoA kinase [Burkholderiales bacterium]
MEQWPLPHPARTRWGRLSIGLTGGIGCGKSTVANLFAARGAAIIDTDRIAHSLTAPGGAAMPQIAAQFGDAFVQDDGALNRAKMREHVFAQASEKRRLEAILHPMISARCAEEALAAKGSYLIFDVPLLAQSSHWQQNVERILVVDCPVEVQLARVMSRNNLSEQQVLAIIASQAPRATRLELADDVIDNQGDITLLTAQVERLHQEYLRLAML